LGVLADPYLSNPDLIQAFSVSGFSHFVLNLAPDQNASFKTKEKKKKRKGLKQLKVKKTQKITKSIIFKRRLVKFQDQPPTPENIQLFKQLFINFLLFVVWCHFGLP
jgi:hypothetical protein